MWDEWIRRHCNKQASNGDGVKCGTHEAKLIEDCPAAYTSPGTVASDGGYIGRENSIAITTPSDLTSARVPHAPGAPPSSPNPRGSDVDEILLRDCRVPLVFMRASGILLVDALATWLSLVASWRSMETRSTNSTSALLELNPLDDQDQWDLDRQELREFRQQQPLVPGPLSPVPRTSPLVGDSSPPPRAPVTKKRKRLVKVDSGSTPKRRRPEKPVRSHRDPSSHSASWFV
ncbi:hypothetical protein C8R41DRAFT_872426 [Lentinula lateritia]|uniref:Uncharacterized protein n=1 Tax=Lentinula lateritia TaxID=40482 RepID=A0ABQ8V2G4_9AGAR|nr:hypothetical protein C8R41DRAFT_872426 [Lentinula lateritia]